MSAELDFSVAQKHAMRTLRSWLTAMVFSLLAFCFGCGGGSGGSSPPPPATYTISGTVSGLAAGAFVGLQNNGTDAVTILSNGSFSFSKPINSGTSYDVYVWAQPQNPVQFCVVSDGKGIATADVSNVQVNCTTPTAQTLYDFVGPQSSNESNPSGSLVFDSSGSLYGTTTGDSPYSYGEVFKLTPSNGHWTETVLYTFCQLAGCTDGGTPTAGVIWDTAGNLYGTTSAGGGTVFELVPGANGTWTEKVLHSFGSGNDGSGPSSGLVFDKSGNLYGTTYNGGNSTGCEDGCGTVFELSPSSGGWTEKVIYSFCSASGSYCPDGANPKGGVVLDAAGNLYGITYNGGGNAAQYGVAFELSPDNSGTWAEKVLYAFQGGSTDGANPASALIFDSSGNLYGTTVFGYEASGINNGVVFELSPAAEGQWKETIVYGFCVLQLCADGSSPYAPLVFDKSGNLYGTASLGAVVFALTPGLPGGLWSESPLYSFGDLTFSGLVMDAAGNLYGVAGGGTNEAGQVFEVTP